MSTKVAEQFAPRVVGQQIASHISACVSDFDKLSFELSTKAPYYYQEMQLSNINDERGRFRIWSGNTGAHLTGPNSLAYRLRDASHIQCRVITLLEELEEKLRKSTSIINGEQIPWDAFSDVSSESSSIAMHETREELISYDTFLEISSDMKSSTNEPEAETELGQLMLAITEIVSCLMRLSLTIENPAPHDLLNNLSKLDVFQFESADISHICSRFPTTQAFLTERLGKAISRRRQYLQYREEQYKKNPRAESSHVKGVTRPSGSGSDNILDLRTGKAIQDHEAETDTEASDSTSRKVPKNLRRLEIPPLPRGARPGSPFLCPFCFMQIVILDLKTWNKHVLTDLKPYVCTQENCQTPERLYESRDSWFEHEMQLHRTRWRCIEDCSQYFYDTMSFESHLRHRHPQFIANEQPQTIFKDYETRLDMNSFCTCNLCHKSQNTLTDLRRHLGSHQEELALFALSPPPLENTEPRRSHAQPEQSTSAKGKTSRFKSFFKKKSHISEADKISQRIDDMILRESESKPVKTLLLGAGESGKTNMLKQIKLHTCVESFTKAERLEWRWIIFRNLVTGCQMVIDAMEDMGYHFEEESCASKYLPIIMQEKDIHPWEELPLEYLAPIKGLWGDRGFQEAVQRGNEFALNDNIPYFMDNIDRIFTREYLPTDHDILNARLRTTGVTETIFDLGRAQWRVFDVGGQRSERKKWIHAFENIQILIFLVSMSGINSCLVEDMDGDQMQEALMLWESIVNSHWFKEAKIVLVFNKMDIFVSRLVTGKIPFKEHFPEYSSDPGDIEGARNFIMEKFKSLNWGDKEIHIECTSLTEQDEARITVAFVKNLVGMTVGLDSGNRLD